MPEKERIAILGGGISSLVTAHALTSQPNWRERYDITVYQMGWRLGGKGASGRNREAVNRIEEHGIHVFFGFYDNAFRIMKECYEELDRPKNAPLARVTDAWKPHPRITFAEKHDGEWSIWPWDFPLNDAKLGEGGEIPTPWGQVRQLLAHMTQWYEQVMSGVPADLEAKLASWSPEMAKFFDGVEDALGVEILPQIIDRFWRRKRTSAFATVRTVVAALEENAKKIHGDPNPASVADRAALAQVVKRARLARQAARWIAYHVRDFPTLRRALVLFDFAATTIIGLIEDGVVFPPEDWRKIDGIDFQKWLRRHGAAPETASCSLILGMYAGIFSTEHEVGAGTMLHYTLRMLFTYRGAVYHKMQAGMGDVIFAPLYEVLARRGVRFEFFHRVDRLELDADKRRIARIVIGRQIGVRADSNGGRYEPLFDVNGLPCWPSAPLFEQLVEGERLKASGENLEDAWTSWQDTLPPLTLEDGRDFDRVVLGISLGALPWICRELVENPRDARWRQMLASLVTVETQAMQLWMKPSVPELGWKHGDSITIPYEEPYDTWTDMIHLLPRESWPKGAVGSIAYLCSPLPDLEPVPPQGPSDYARRQNARAKDNAREWLERYAGWFWPDAADASGRGLDWSKLVDLREGTGVERFATQHFAAPHNPSDRYNLSLPGTAAARLPADGSGYDNLVITGDWIWNPINAGCVEAATSAGLLAARAILGAGSGASIKIAGDWISQLSSRSTERATERAAERGPDRSVERSGDRSVGRTELPMYIHLDGNDTPLPPFEARGTRMSVFPLVARMEALERLCLDTLQLGGPALYRPAAPLVFVYAQDNREISAARPRAAVRELDFGFLIPLVAREPGRPARFVTFIPYLWVDTELACRAGREIYGYPKGAGKLSVPEDRRGVFSIDALVPEHGAWNERRVLEVRPSSPVLPKLTSSLEFLAGLGRELTSGLSTVETATVLRELAAGVVPMIFLKQFRDVVDPSRACYQAIVEAATRQTGNLCGGLLGGHHAVEIHDSSGLPLATRLGIVGERTPRGTVLASAPKAFWLDFDFVLDTGRVVWSASATAVK